MAHPLKAKPRKLKQAPTLRWVPMQVSSPAQLVAGDQIMYVPQHAMVGSEPDPEHYSVEYGFVACITPAGRIMCRFWHRNAEGTTLRTLSCSEEALPESLWRVDYMDQDALINYLESFGLEDVAAGIIQAQRKARHD